MNKDVKLMSPFKTMLITIGELPTAYIESMSYYEGLCYLVNYLCNNVIPALNQNGEAVKELQDKFIELQNYVNNYFDNLDVQEEINNKLDEMAEQGELTSIILAALQLNSLLMFDTISDLKAAENLIKGNFCETAGSLTLIDGLTNLYKIVDKEDYMIIDDEYIVGLDNYPDLVAYRLSNYYIEAVDNKVGELIELETEEKYNTVLAINEVLGKTDTNSTNIGDLAELDTSDKTSIVNAINENVTNIESKMSSYGNYKDQFYYYVDGINGDDDNDGLTSANAFKTLDKFFSLLNTTSSDIRCYILTAGTYKLNHSQVLNSNIHIVGESGSRNDIIITTDEAEMVFYGGHINFKNVTWNMPYNYFDNALISLDNCILTQPLRAYGGGVEIKNSTFNQLRLSWSKGVLQNVVIDGQDKTNNAIQVDSCSELTCFDGLTISALSNSNNYGVIGCYRGTLHLVGTITDNSHTNDYYNGIVGNHMLVDSTATVISDFNSIGSHGNDLGHALVWTNSQNLPI